MLYVIRAKLSLSGQHSTVKPQTIYMWKLWSGTSEIALACYNTHFKHTEIEQ